MNSKQYRSIVTLSMAALAACGAHEESANTALSQLSASMPSAESADFSGSTSQSFDADSIENTDVQKRSSERARTPAPAGISADLKAIAQASLAANIRKDHPKGGSDATSPSSSPGNSFTQGIPGDDVEQTALYSVASITGEEGGFDIFNAVNPADSSPGTGLVTAFYSGVNAKGKDAPGDRYLLGDHKKAWYLGRTGEVDNDFARILDFDVRGGNQIVLYGAAENYVMVKTEGDEVGTAIFYNNGGVYDMIGFVDGQDLTDASNSVYKYAKAPPSSAKLASQLDQFGGAGGDLITAITADNAGNVYVTGVSRSNLARIFPNGGGSGQMFAAKYSSSGARVWLRQFGSADKIGDLAWDLAVDSSAVYVAARYIAPDTARGDVKNSAYFKLSVSDGSILKEAQWADDKVQFAGTVALDNNDAVYFSGIGYDPAQPNPDGSQDPYIEKRKRSDLSLIKRKMFGGDKDNVAGSGNAQNKEPWGGLAFSPKSGAAAGKGTIYSSGWTMGSYEGTTAVGGGDVWLVAFDQDLNELWHEGWGSDQRDWAWDLDTDRNGFVYVVGLTLGSMAGSGSNKGQSDGFVTKIDPTKSNGQRVVWTKQLGTTKADELRKIRIVGDAIYVSGHTYGNISDTNAGNSDLWVAKLDLNGNVLNQYQVGTPEDDRGMITANSNNVYIGGYTTGSMVKQSKGFFDAFVLKLTTALGNP
jgi:hypothetical protein